jgi:hypothetical protein
MPCKVSRKPRRNALFYMQGWSETYSRGMGKTDTQVRGFTTPYCTDALLRNGIQHTSNTPRDNVHSWYRANIILNLPHTHTRTRARASKQHTHTQNKQTPWSESASELYRPSDRCLSAKRLPTFADKGCHVVSITDAFGRILGFLDRSRYFSTK